MDVYKELIEKMKDAVFVIADDNSERLFVNKAYVDLYGLPSEEAAKKASLIDLILPEDVHLIRERVNARIQGKPLSNILSYRIRRPADGEVRVMETTSVTVNWEGRPATFAVIRDVTEKVREQEIHAYNSAIINSLAESVIGTNGEGVITSWSTGAVHLYGYTAKEAIGKHVSMLVPSHLAHEVRQVMQKMLKGEVIEQFETTRMRKGGATFDMSITLAPIFDEEGKLVTIASVGRDISERKRSERRIAQMAATVESSRDAIYTVDTNRRIISWNHGAETIYGYSAEEVTGKLIDLLAPRDRADEPAEIIARVLSGAKLDQLETVRQKKDGSIFDVSLTISPVFNLEGQITSIAYICQDITDRKRAERRIAQLAAIVESSKDAIYMVDTNKIVINWNYGAELVYGFSSEEAVGKSIDFIVPPDRAGEPAQIMARVMNGSRVDQFETIRQKKDGSRIDVSLTISPVYNAERKIISIAIIAQDITERKRSEQQIAHLATIVESSSDAVFSTTIDGTILNWNPGAEIIYGYSAEEIVGKSISILLAQDRKGHIPGVLQRLDSGERSPNMESTHITKDGRKIHISYTVSPIKDKTGKAVAIAVINRDISDLVALEAQFRQAQKMEAIGRLAGGVAHDFNNLLTPILGFSEIGLQELESSSPMRLYFEEISKAAEGARNVTRQLLSFSQKQLLETVVFNANDLISEMSTLIRRLVGEDIQVAVNLNKNPWMIKADKTEIQQVLMNLVVNSRDAMPEGGKITIETSNFIANASYAAKHPEVGEGEYFSIEVRDTGTGMSKEVKQHLFEPFFTTKEKGKGTGLGLATSYAIIDQSRGNIIVDSEIGAGTSIKILLPRTADSVAQTKPAVESPISEKLSKGYERILLVEDNDAVRQVTNQMLTKLGYAATQASNGAEGLEIAKTDPSQFPLVLTDVVMPNMSGKQMADELLKIYPKTKVVFMSGYMDEPVLQHGLSESSVILIRKPFTLSLLASKIREVLDKNPSAR